MENCNYRNQHYRNRMQNSCNYRQNNSCQNNSCQNNFCQEKNTCAVKEMESMTLGMSYVPWQHWKETYDSCKALSAGTIFPELNLPFLERSCGR